MFRDEVPSIQKVGILSQLFPQLRAICYMKIRKKICDAKNNIYEIIEVDNIERLIHGKKSLKQLLEGCIVNPESNILTVQTFVIFESWRLVEFAITIMRL